MRWWMPTFALGLLLVTSATSWGDSKKQVSSDDTSQTCAYAALDAVQQGATSVRKQCNNNSLILESFKIARSGDFGGCRVHADATCASRALAVSEAYMTLVPGESCESAREYVRNKSESYPGWQCGRQEFISASELFCEQDITASAPNPNKFQIVFQVECAPRTQ
jgi:hypothetical protein